MTLVLLSGAIATGKTAVAEELSRVLGADHVRVRQALVTVLGISLNDRVALQREGTDLDRRTRGRWLRDYLAEHYRDHNAVVDSLRTMLQTLPVLESEAYSHLVYLEAHETTRRARYALAAAADPVKASLDFDTAMRHPTEQAVVTLRQAAHLVVETDELSAAGVARIIVDELRLHANGGTRA